MTIASSQPIGLGVFRKISLHWVDCLCRSLPFFRCSCDWHSRSILSFSSWSILSHLSLYIPFWCLHSSCPSVLPLVSSSKSSFLLDVFFVLLLLFLSLVMCISQDWSYIRVLLSLVIIFVVSYCCVEHTLTERLVDLWRPWSADSKQLQVKDLWYRLVNLLVLAILRFCTRHSNLPLCSFHFQCI